MSNHAKNKGPGFFDRTQWSTILKAQVGSEHTRLSALARLLQRYRDPIIMHVQHSRRCEREEAEELTHEFIEHWMQKNLLKNVSPERGSFRCYIKQSIGHFLISSHRHGEAEKRKPRGGVVSIDETKDGLLVHQPPAREVSPDEEMDRAWAQQIVANALSRLEEECTKAGRLKLFTALKGCLGADASTESYASRATRLGMSETAVKTAVHRLRQRFGELIEDEVKETISNREDWQEELRYLIELIGKC